MNIFPFAAAILVAAPFAVADEIVLTKPLQGASLHSAQVDMSVYWVEAEAGYEVVSTYVPRDQSEAPARIVMALKDGDEVTFGLPGYPDSQFRYLREKDVVKVSTYAIKTQLVGQ